MGIFIKITPVPPVQIKITSPAIYGAGVGSVDVTVVDPDDNVIAEETFTGPPLEIELENYSDGLIIISDTEPPSPEPEQLWLGPVTP